MASWLLRVFAVIYVVRFAWPALSAASGASVFGEPWLPDGGASLLLDSDIRYWGVTSATIAALFALGSVNVRRSLVWMDLVFFGVLIGAAIRTWEMAVFGLPPGPAVVATVFEWVFPLAWFATTARLRATKRYGIEESIEVAVPKARMWEVFADFGSVHAWHPYMESASLDDPSHGLGVGAARTCRFGPKMAIRETVREWDDAGAMTIAIDFLEGFPPPIHDILASVRVEPLGAERSRLVLSMSFRSKLGPLGGILAEAFVLGQYRAVFGGMLGAAKRWAETGETSPPIAMPLSGRRLPEVA